MTEQITADHDTANVLERALVELEQAIQPLTKNLPDPLTTDGYDAAQIMAYLNLLWAPFHIYPIEPFAGGEQKGYAAANITTLANGRKIYDYGFVLSTSAGEETTSYCQGKLYETIHAMIELLSKRGITQIMLEGNSLAMRVAWLECVVRQIEITNYEPDGCDLKVRERIRMLKEKAKRLRPDQELRL